MAKPWSFLVIAQKIFSALYPTKRENKLKLFEGVAKPRYFPDAEQQIQPAHSIQLTLPARQK